MKKITKKQKKLFATVALAAAVLAGLYAFAHSNKGPIDPPSTSLEGIVVCLPPKGEGPHTKECAMGLMTSDRSHYILDLSRISLEAGSLQVSDRIRATGVLVPVSPEIKYDVQGAFTVTDSLTVE